MNLDFEGELTPSSLDIEGLSFAKERGGAAGDGVSSINLVTWQAILNCRMYCYRAGLYTRPYVLRCGGAGFGVGGVEVEHTGVFLLRPGGLAGFEEDPGQAEMEVDLAGIGLDRLFVESHEIRGRGAGGLEQIAEEEEGLGIGFVDRKSVV